MHRTVCQSLKIKKEQKERKKLWPKFCCKRAIGKKRNIGTEEWIQVQRRRFRNRFIGKTGKAVSDTGSHFKAADIRIPLFISNVNKEVSAQNICDYIESKAQVTVSVEKINMKHDRPYNAFKIFVPKHRIEIFLNDNFWPDGVTFREYVHFHRRPSPAQNKMNQRAII